MRAAGNRDHIKKPNIKLGFLFQLVKLVKQPRVCAVVIESRIESQQKVYLSRAVNHWPMSCN